MMNDGDTTMNPGVSTPVPPAAPVAEPAPETEAVPAAPVEETPAA